MIGVIEIMALVAVVAFVGWMVGSIMQRRQQPARERALRVQVQALESALDITREAWQAKTAMHEEARRLRGDGWS